MFYTLIVGHPPFDTREVRSTLNRVLAVDYELPSTVSSEAADLINSLLRREPQERLKLKAIIQHPFMLKKSRPQRHMVSAFVHIYKLFVFNILFLLMSCRRESV